MSAEYFKSGLLTFHKRAQHAVKKLQDPLLFRPGSVAPSLLGEDSGTRVTITTQSFLHDQCTSELPIPAAGSCWSMLRDCGLAAGDGSTAVRGTLDGFRMKVSLQPDRSCALSISGIIIVIAQWDPCMVLLACSLAGLACVGRCSACAGRASSVDFILFPRTENNWPVTSTLTLTLTLTLQQTSLYYLATATPWEDRLRMKASHVAMLVPWQLQPSRSSIL